MSFRDRRDAGRQLAQRLQQLPRSSPLVFGLPRGGVPVAAEVAAALGAPLDVFVARKVGLPGHEELGIGAIAEGMVEPIVSEAARSVGIRPADLGALATKARRELDRRVASYRGERAVPAVAGRDVIVVDDGLATGVTAEAALRSLRSRNPNRLILAVPVCTPETARRLRGLADAVVCVEAPQQFSAVGQWYEDFSQTTDAEVVALLAAAQPAHREA